MLDFTSKNNPTASGSSIINAPFVSNKKRGLTIDGSQLLCLAAGVFQIHTEISTSTGAAITSDS